MPHAQELARPLSNDEGRLRAKAAAILRLISVYSSFRCWRQTASVSDAISWRGTLTQYAGRLHRLNAAKREVIIYDYVDFEVPVLARMSARRRKGYKSIGYEITELDNKRKPVQLRLANLR
jgi:hypothetical protein